MISPVSPTDSGAAEAVAVERLGIAPTSVVQEFGYDDDVSEEFRYAVEDACGSELEDEDYTGGADAVLLWWRDGDGDLIDTLVDMVGVLDEGGFVVLLTPKAGHEAEVDPSEIDEAAMTTGMHPAGSFAPAPEWRATKLVAPKAKR